MCWFNGYINWIEDFDSRKGRLISTRTLEEKENWRTIKINEGAIASSYSISKPNKLTNIVTKGTNCKRKQKEF